VTGTHRGRGSTVGKGLGLLLRHPLVRLLDLVATGVTEYWLGAVVAGASVALVHSVWGPPLAILVLVVVYNRVSGALRASLWTVGWSYVAVLVIGATALARGPDSWSPALPGAGAVGPAVLLGTAGVAFGVGLCVPVVWAAYAVGPMWARSAGRWARAIFGGAGAGLATGTGVAALLDGKPQERLVVVIGATAIGAIGGAVAASARQLASKA
jgi:hypothetical protein